LTELTGLRFQDPTTLNYFLVGNGSSRVGLDLTRLTGGIVLGFNRSYKDFPFDIVCTQDVGVSEEVQENWPGDWINRGWTVNGTRDVVYFNDDAICKLPLICKDTDWNAGRCVAYALATQIRPHHVYLFGFDIDTGHIAPKIPRTLKYRRYEIPFWDNIFSHGVDFTRVGPVDEMTPLLNCSHMSRDEFYSLPFAAFSE
jgi:hypothetical protein